MSICSWRVFVYTKTSLLYRTTAIHGRSDAVDALRFAKASDIINYQDNTHVITDYRYDSFGRRIHTAERTKSGMRTIYDGLSFEVVKEAETFLGTRGITSSATGEANLTNYNPHGSDHTRGTRYYFIRDRGQELRTGKSGEALPDRTKGVRTYLYLNDERVAVNNLYNTNHGQYYYGSDILGSVKFVTGQGGQELKRIEYDVFGGIYKGNSPYGLETGYTGKPYDAVTSLSDYGFRDYSPTHAMFITEDLIRDGENWFAYVGNNPVNWVDPWGLSPVDGKGNSNHFTNAEARGLNVRYYYADGSGIERSGGSRSWRNNNPGNIRSSSKKIGMAGGFAVFKDYNTGFSAIVDLLQSNTYSVLTINDAISRYAPPVENDTKNYQEMLTKFTGVESSRVINTLTNEEVSNVARAIERIEGYKVGTETAFDSPNKIKGEYYYETF